MDATMETTPLTEIILSYKPRTWCVDKKFVSTLCTYLIGVSTWMKMLANLYHGFGGLIGCNHGCIDGCIHGCING